ncbi:hypothetical protein MA16_Dca009220 [Dendrobium catenatum]|uniref:Uncharacterized protein n=1 Tax=Dendrobium catenatum TaxID=906689 RepID=A0A2I0VR57_9ASPA|nr:hypothetical protein MA16_Dca009220 [Dendrobium catenatum]
MDTSLSIRPNHLNLYLLWCIFPFHLNHCLFPSLGRRVNQTYEDFTESVNGEPGHINCNSPFRFSEDSDGLTCSPNSTGKMDSPDLSPLDSRMDKWIGRGGQRGPKQEEKRIREGEKRRKNFLLDYRWSSSRLSSDDRAPSDFQVTLEFCPNATWRRSSARLSIDIRLLFDAGLLLDVKPQFITELLPNVGLLPDVRLLLDGGPLLVTGSLPDVGLLPDTRLLLNVGSPLVIGFLPDVKLLPNGRLLFVAELLFDARLMTS